MSKRVTLDGLAAVILVVVTVAVGVDLSAQARNTAVRWWTDMPRPAIEREWSQGHYITSVTAGSRSSGVVLSSRAGYEGQDYRESPKWPQDFVLAERAQEAYITEIGYRDGMWLVVTSNGSGFRGQRWAWASSSSLLEELRDVRSRGCHVTDVAFGTGGGWSWAPGRPPSAARSLPPRAAFPVSSSTRTGSGATTSPSVATATTRGWW